jgi:putative DNA primase/helicase
VDIIICADDDAETKGNPGITKAAEAALAVNGKVATPDFGDARPDGATDFNDVAVRCGAEAVKRAVGEAISPSKLAAVSERASSNSFANWSAPQPLVTKVELEPYPLDALPATIRAAVIEVQGFTKAPIAMVALSAMSALSLAIQAQVDIGRAHGLTGPCSLFGLVIADSGERKSTCDGKFTNSIREYEAQQVEIAKPLMRAYQAAIGAWEAKRNGIKDKIRHLAKDSKPTQEYEERLRDLENHEPIKPRVPRLIYADATPEALTHSLYKNWPSGGVVSAEAGSVLGAHGMGSESVMRNLAMFNQLWDGNPLTIDRRTSESYTVRGARLTIALQVQEATLRDFLERSGTLARGTGFLARFLLAWPESTQGYRAFTEPPESWPAMEAFNQRIARILNLALPLSANGSSSPAMLTLSPDAKAAWIAYHDAIECELKNSGELYDVRDVAAKSADNAARIAALFHVFESNQSSEVGIDSINGAGRIAAWHLNESRRLFGEIALPKVLSDAARLEAWLIEYCKRENVSCVPIAALQQTGPGSLRKKEAHDPAISELTTLNRLRIVTKERNKLIELNPAIIEGGGV